MSAFDEIRNSRIEKLNTLKKEGINPFPAKTNRDFTLKEVVEKFDELLKKDSVCLAGRIMAIRGQGALIFFNLNDGTGEFQGLLKKDEMEAGQFNLFVSTIDVGDFVEISGKLFVTQRGQKTLQVKTWRILTKSLRPLPDKWDGLQDEEERLRKRYLDIMFNPEVRDMVAKRSVFWQATREFLLNKGFMEVETPVLENTTGGAEARPFITQHNALDLPVYLRISPELWLKKIMVSGFPKVFEIGRDFRNEGMDAEHLQDYTMMECYEAYSDYEKGMAFVEEMYKFVINKTFGTLKFKIKTFEIDLGQKWEVYDYRETIKKMTGLDINKADLEEVEMKLKELKVVYERGDFFNLPRAFDNLWKYCRRQIPGPGFLINVPVMMEPLAKRMEKNPNLVERFQIILAGSEMGKGFSELNDPIDQLGRFEEQEKMRESGDDEAQMKDDTFVEALEYGMPPTFGFGFSERLFSFLMNKPARDCQIFPLLRPKKD